VFHLCRDSQSVRHHRGFVTSSSSTRSSAFGAGRQHPATGSVSPASRVIYTSCRSWSSSVFSRPRSSSRTGSGQSQANVTVDVNAFQWAGSSPIPHRDGRHRPDDPGPTMVIPVNTNVHINLTSTDVIHGFYVRPSTSRATPCRRAQPVHARSGQDRKLLRAVHAALRSLHSLMFFNVKSSRSRSTPRAGEHGEPRRLRRRSKDDGSTDGHAGSTKPASSHGITNG